MKLAGVVFFLVGTGLLIGSFFIYSNHQKFLSTAKEAEGKVVDLIRETSKDSDGKTSTTYRPVIAFQVEGKEYEANSGSASNPPSYDVGENVKLKYDPKNPNDILLDGFFENWGALLICGGLGIVFFSVGLGVLFKAINKSKITKWLKANGQSVQTTFDSVYLNTSYKVNGRSPYVIQTNWLDTLTNTAYVFESDNIWYNPESYINPEQKITVLIDSANPKRHWMDISFLPNKG